ncbi:anti-sigma factor domain-containing protein [Fictibacillus aquaticus]|uniref:anti-sigma factor domain-containing protein n=1 Tax=Fictibacillus aquaticus TaxID=2021314 RepID=UPI0013FDDD02|nr:anti-sigma factor domain-containing protein [Fictibacillus aquaticus]
MSKAIIVELNKKHAIVLAEGGSFIKVPRKSSYKTIGQEIDASGMIQQKLRGFSFLNWKTSLAAAAAALMLFFQFFYPFTGQEVYASVSMEMEPSIEIEINKDLNVVDIQTYNEQGEDVLKSIDNWRGQPITAVTKKIFKLSSAKGFIKPHQEVLIATTITEDISTKEETAIKKHVSTLMQKEAKKQNLEMTSVVLSKKEKMKAAEYGISPGQYAILAAAKQKGHHMTANEVKNKSIRKISEEVGPVKNLFEDSELPVSKRIENKQSGAIGTNEGSKGKLSSADSNLPAKEEIKKPSALRKNNLQKKTKEETGTQIIKKQETETAAEKKDKENAKVKESIKTTASKKEVRTEKEIRNFEQEVAFSPNEKAENNEPKKQNDKKEADTEKKSVRSLPIAETAAAIEEIKAPPSSVLMIEITVNTETEELILSVEAATNVETGEVKLFVEEDAA